MRIKIGVGLDNLVFGMSQEEVKKIMGCPDKISETEKEDGIVYYFNDPLIKTKFDKNEDCKMYSIEVYNPEVFMFNQKIINMNKDEFLNLLKSNGYCETVEEDYTFFDTIFCEEIWSTFSFELGRLTDMEFSPLSDKDGKSIWPIIEVDSVKGGMPKPLWNYEMPMGGKATKIKIGIGLDDLIFGMSQEEVKYIAGEPDKVTEIEECGWRVYDFNDLLIKTKFDKNEDYKMDRIEVLNPEVLVFNQKIINKRKSEILDLLELNGYCEIEEEDYDLFDTILCEEIWMDFSFEFGRLKSVEIGPLFDNGDKKIWPERLNDVNKPLLAPRCGAV